MLPSKAMGYATALAFAGIPNSFAGPLPPLDLGTINAPRADNPDLPSRYVTKFDYYEDRGEWCGDHYCPKGKHCQYQRVLRIGVWMCLPGEP